MSAHPFGHHRPDETEGADLGAWAFLVLVACALVALGICLGLAFGGSHL